MWWIHLWQAVDDWTSRFTCGDPIMGNGDAYGQRADVTGVGYFCMDAQDVQDIGLGDGRCGGRIHADGIAVWFGEPIFRLAQDERWVGEG